MPNGVFFLVRLFFAVAGSALMTWAAWKMGGREWALLAFVFSTPLIGVAIAKPLIEMAHDGLSWLWHHPLEAWHGNYYAFNSVHVRVFDDGERLWFCAADIVHACHLKALAPAIPGVEQVENLPSLTIEGVERFHEGHPHPELARFLLWAQREVIMPWRRKRSGTLIPD
jgi:hypothetical protein